MDTVSGIEAGPPPKFEDSDDEDDYYGLDSGESDPECEDVADETMFNTTPPAAAQDESGLKDADIPAPQQIGEPVFQESLENLMDLELVDGDPDSRNVQRKLSHPSSPRSQVSSLGQGENEQEQVAAMPEVNSIEKPVPGPDKVRVVIRDAAYATYRAVLYYVSRILLFVLESLTSVPCRFTPMRFPLHHWPLRSPHSLCLLQRPILAKSLPVLGTTANPPEERGSRLGSYLILESPGPAAQRQYTV